MPRSLDPNATVEIVLETEQHLEHPPTFIFKALTVREEEQLGKIYDFEKDEENKLSDRMQQSLEPFLRGWKNMGDKVFGEDSLVDIVSTMEAFDLAAQLLASGRVSYEEKKRSESQHSSEPESSVSPAEKNVASSIKT